MAKGQSRVFEQVLLFAIGVAIFIASFAIFQLQQGQYVYTSTDDQLRAVRDMAYDHMLMMIVAEDVNASIVLQVPRKIGGEGYTVSAEAGDITVRTDESGRMASVNVDALNVGGAYSFRGESSSSGGEIIIYKRGNNIIIE